MNKNTPGAVGFEILRAVCIKFSCDITFQCSFLVILQKNGTFQVQMWNQLRHYSTLLWSLNSYSGVSFATHSWISKCLLESVVLQSDVLSQRNKGGLRGDPLERWRSCAASRASAWKAPAQIKHWVQQGHAALNEPPVAALQDFSMGRLIGAHSSSEQARL